MGIREGPKGEEQPLTIRAKGREKYKDSKRKSHWGNQDNWVGKIDRRKERYR